jgi:ubiquinone/menaquinone biosynthesis C-methylase UbiE
MPGPLRMGDDRKFDPARAARLNDPTRLELLVPEIMWSAAAVAGPHVIVDIGAGSGLVSVAFARLAPDATVYAADVSAEMLAYLVAHLPDDVGGRVVPVLSEEAHVPLGDGIADLVTMVTLYHELNDPVATLRDAQRLLAPGGRLLVVDWAKEQTLSGPPMAHRVAGVEIAASLAAAGFGDVEMHEALRGFSVVTATRP